MDGAVLNNNWLKNISPDNGSKSILFVHFSHLENISHNTKTVNYNQFFQLYILNLNDYLYLINW